MVFAEIEHSHSQVVANVGHSHVVLNRPFGRVLDPGVLDHPDQTDATDRQQHDQDRERDQPPRSRLTANCSDHSRLILSPSVHP